MLGTMAETLMGRVTGPIIDTADEVAADMIVMSTHALTGPVRTVVGSTADEVVRAAQRPGLASAPALPPTHTANAKARR